MARSAFRINVSSSTIKDVYKRQVLISVVLTGFQLYEPLAKWCGAGTLVPVSYTHLDVYKRQHGKISELIWILFARM